MARPQPLSHAATHLPPARAAGVIVRTALAYTGLASSLAWAVAATTGFSPSFLAVAILGAFIGVMAAPPIRLPLERRDAAGQGLLIVLTGMVAMAALMAAMGLAVLAAATSVALVAHATQARPATRQLVQTCTTAVAVTAATWVGQYAGLLDALVNPTLTAVLMVGLWALLIPVMLNAADMSRRAARSAGLLDQERRAHVAALQHTVSHDGLTGLLSRRGLEAPLAQAAAAARPGHLSAVLFVDLDGFKAVNDVHGHDAGDALLSELGQRLGAALGGEAWAARIGGDEFVVVVRGLGDEAAAHALAGRLQVLLEELVILPGGVQVSVGASTGVACWQVAGGAAELLAQADAAMYAAKRARRAHRDKVGTC